jgi:hypothetical protein
VRAQLPLLDDLGVAYDKLGRASAAIEEGRKALALAPDRYESLANLGTYLVHAGQADEGLPLLRKALAVKPDGHFGRLRIQIAVIEYLESRREEGTLRLPLFAEEAGAAGAWASRVPRAHAHARGRDGDAAFARRAHRRRQDRGGHDLRRGPRRPCAARGAGARDRGSQPACGRGPRLARACGAGVPGGVAGDRADGGGGGVLRGRRALEAPEGAAPDPKALTLARAEAAFATERVAAADFIEEVWADEKEWIATSKDPEAAFAARYFVPQVDKVTVRDTAAMRAASRGGYAEDIAGTPEAEAPAGERLTMSTVLCCDRSAPYPLLLVIVLGLLGGRAC